MTSAVAAMPLARKAVTFSFCHGSRSARTAMAILVSKRMVIGTSFLDSPAHGAQMVAERQRGVLLPPGQVAIEAQLAAERDTGPDLVSLAVFGVADRLGDGEQLRGASRGHEEHAVLVAEDQVALVTVQSSTAAADSASGARASRRRGPAGVAPRLNTGSPISWMSAVSRCRPQITMPASPAA